MEFIRKLFDTSDYPPRWSCGNWTPFEGWLHIVSDFGIFVAYATIPAALLVILIRRRGKHPFPGILFLFVAFILSCGITHLIDAIIFYQPIYRVSGLMKAITAVVSLTTAVVLVRAMPRILEYPLIEKENKVLTQLVKEQADEQAALDDTRVELESRSAQMTSKVRRYAQALESAWQVACQWTIDTDQFEWELGFAGSARAVGLPEACGANWGDLVGKDEAARLHRECHAISDAARPYYFEAALVCLPSHQLRLSASADPVVKGAPRVFRGVFRIVAGPTDLNL